MIIPTEPIGSIPRTPELLSASAAEFASAAAQALRDTIRRFEQTGSPVITDGEQTKPSFATYPLDGLANLAPDGVVIPFADGHTRQLPRLTAGPFRYAVHASKYLAAAKRLTDLPLKQAVISASALSLLYPSRGIPGYSREAFLSDLIKEAATDIRECLEQGAHSVQIDFTEARLSLKLDPSGALLESFAVDPAVAEVEVGPQRLPPLVKPRTLRAEISSTFEKWRSVVQGAARERWARAGADLGIPLPLDALTVDEVTVCYLPVYVAILRHRDSRRVVVIDGGDGAVDQPLATVLTAKLGYLTEALDSPPR